MYNYQTCVKTMQLIYRLILIRSAKMEETSGNQIKCNNKYSKLISIELLWMNQVEQHFEDLEYLNINSIHDLRLLSNITTP